MRRALVLLGVSVALVLAGCGSSDAPPDSTGTAAVSDPSPTATPTSTVTSPGSPSTTATETLSPEATLSPSGTTVATATATPTATVTPEPTATPEATATPQATATAEVTATPEATAPPPPPPPPSGVVADIRGFGYPYELHVAVGTTVTWVNHDAVPHDVVAFDETWASPMLGEGGTFARSFSAPGRYPYFCSVHPYMQAVVIAE